MHWEPCAGAHSVGPASQQHDNGQSESHEAGRSERSDDCVGENRGENVNVRNKTNVHANVNVNDRTRFTNVTRITSNGRTFDRVVFRDRNDRRLHLGFHDRIFFINNFSEVVLINGCSFFLDDGIFWPAFIIGESCVHPRNVVFIAVD